MIIKTNRKSVFSRSILTLIGLVLVVATVKAQPVRSVDFHVHLDPSLATSEKPVSGRLLIFMTRSDKPMDMIEPDFTNPNSVWISGMEVTNLQLKKAIDVNADKVSFPAAFSSAPAGEYHVMALLDRDHSYTYFQHADAGDIYSLVQKVNMPAGEMDITLSRIVPDRVIGSHPNSRIVEFKSPMLSAFWGRPITMQASIVLPVNYDKSATTRYPTAYIIHGYGGTHLPGNIHDAVERAMQQMKDGSLPEMIYVFLNAHNSLGHHAFADSVNNGPWGTALVKELIPYLEKQFRMDARPSGRFLTGHSSGGWSTLWVMISHPDFFGGTWSTSPDPVDFRNFTGPDLYRPGQNAYIDANGKDYGLVRVNGKDMATIKQFTQQEVVLGEYGGQFGSFNAVFSPRGPDGGPMKMFDVETGVIDPSVAKAWEKYDIAHVLRDNWNTLGPKLKGKIHIIVGTADTFHLDEPVRLLDAELRKLGSDAKIEYLEGRDHFNLYDGGRLRLRIMKEIYAVARPSVKAAAK